MATKRTPKEHSIDPATQEMLERAEELKIGTAFSRADDMAPCNIGGAGMCCKICGMGPCRLTKDGQTQRVQIRLEVVQGPGSTEKNAGDNFFHSYLLSDKGMRFFKRFLKVVEIGDEYLVNGLDYDWLAGREFVGQIVHKDGYCNLVNERLASAWADLTKGNGQAAKIATPAAAAPPTQAFAPQPAMAPQPTMAPSDCRARL